MITSGEWASELMEEDFQFSILLSRYSVDVHRKISERYRANS